MFFGWGAVGGRSQINVVGTVNWLRAGRYGARIPVGTKDFSPLQNAQIYSGAHTASYLTGTGALSRGKAAGASS
jgi:hypothetical protein